MKPVFLQSDGSGYLDYTLTTLGEIKKLHQVFSMLKGTKKGTKLSCRLSRNRNG